MEPRRKTNREQRDASIGALLKAALGLFVSKGYARTNVEEIARRAGLSKGAVYFYFSSKEDLLYALFEQIEEVVIERMLATLSVAGPSARAKIAAFINGQAALGVVDPDRVLLLILISLEFNGKGGRIEDRVKDIYGRMYAALENVIQMGREHGEFRDDLSLKEQVAIIVASHDGTFLEWHRRRAEFDGGKLVRALRTSMLAGLSSRTPSHN
ncbi:MAG: TetR/AcrR family transcriptional regulator [Rhizobiales bacterium]|nr:TetR/AcrR family transcriptional regulator [Hyphomicrobiales bacterium]